MLRCFDTQLRKYIYMYAICLNDITGVISGFIEFYDSDVKEGSIAGTDSSLLFLEERPINWENSYYKNNTIKKLPYKPSQHHIWSLALEQWEEPEGYLQTIQSEAIVQVNQLSSQKILSKYPIYKQLNIARTEEASTMYSWIDNIRNLSNIANANIETSTTLEQINSIVDNFKTELGNIV